MRPEVNVVVLALVAAPLAGLLTVGPVPGFGPNDDVDVAPDPSVDGVRGWNLDDQAGSVRFTDTDLGWIDFAYPVTENLQSEDVRINVTAEWGERSHEDQNQFWLYLYLGPEPDGVYMPAPSVLVYMHPFGERWQRDGVVEIHAEAAGQEGHGAVPEPVCTNVCYGNRTGLRGSSVRMDEFIDVYRNMREEYDNPVAHFFVATGGTEPDRLEIDAEWEKTAVTWRSGSPDDISTYYQDDFEHDIYVGVDPGIGVGTPTMVSPKYVDNGSMTVTWTDAELPVLFRLDPRVGAYHDGHDGELEVRKPDGTLVEYPWHSPFQAMMAGEWEVWYSGQWTAFDTDRPWLWSIDLEWADSVWDEESS